MQNMTEPKFAAYNTATMSYEPSRDHRWHNTVRKGVITRHNHQYIAKNVIGNQLKPKCHYNMNVSK